MLYFGNILAVLDYFAGLKLAFLVTKFPRKVLAKGFTNQFLQEYTTARVQYILLLVLTCSDFLVIRTPKALLKNDARSGFNGASPFSRNE